jgi:TfoX/Sxy family transcriptional regulator of competence genes
MAFNEKLADKVRARLAGLPNIEEKKMMGGLTFMYNDKMCLGIIKDDLMCRIDPVLHETAIARTGCRTMDFTNRPMSGFIMVDERGLKTQKDFNYWVDLALEFNKRAKASKKMK